MESYLAQESMRAVLTQNRQGLLLNGEKNHSKGTPVREEQTAIDEQKVSEEPKETKGFVHAWNWYDNWADRASPLQEECRLNL